MRRDIINIKFKSDPGYAAKQHTFTKNNLVFRAYDAREFLKAAELVLNRSSGVSLPAYFLLGRSIELSLKGFLLSVGVTAHSLSKREYGHNLVNLLAKATRNGLQNQVPIEPIEASVVDLLSQEYCGTRLGYRITGATYYLPRIDITEEVARKLVAGLEYLLVPPANRDT